LIGAVVGNAYAILSYWFLYHVEQPNGYNYFLLCVGYYYPGDKYFRQVNCQPSHVSPYYYCNLLIWETDGYGHYFWAANNACGFVAPTKPGADVGQPIQGAIGPSTKVTHNQNPGQQGQNPK